MRYPCRGELSLQFLFSTSQPHHKTSTQPPPIHIPNPQTTSHPPPPYPQLSQLPPLLPSISHHIIDFQRGSKSSPKHRRCCRPVAPPKRVAVPTPTPPNNITPSSPYLPRSPRAELRVTKANSGRHRSRRLVPDWSVRPDRAASISLAPELGRCASVIVVITPVKALLTANEGAGPPSAMQRSGCGAALPHTPVSRASAPQVAPRVARTAGHSRRGSSGRSSPVDPQSYRSTEQRPVQGGRPRCPGRSSARLRTNARPVGMLRSSVSPAASIATSKLRYRVRWGCRLVLGRVLAVAVWACGWTAVPAGSTPQTCPSDRGGRGRHLAEYRSAVHPRASRLRQQVGSRLAVARWARKGFPLGHIRDQHSE